MREPCEIGRVHMLGDVNNSAVPETDPPPPPTPPSMLEV